MIAGCNRRLGESRLTTQAELADNDQDEKREGAICKSISAPRRMVT